MCVCVWRVVSSEEHPNEAEGEGDLQGSLGCFLGGAGVGS